MHILRAGDYRRMRWKNGGGETAEIAVFPENAGLDDFGWRASMATVEAGGPFSMFSGVDRTLSILDGSGMALDIEGRKPVTLTEVSQPYSFPADVATKAELLGGPIVDLNVMTRRGVYGHTVSVCDLEEPIEVVLKSEATLLFCRSGRLIVSGGERREELGRFDALLLQEPSALNIAGRGQFFLVEFNRI
jgi:uncharacterized protein